MAPGLVGWQNSLSSLKGTVAYRKTPLPKLSPVLLAANEQRRTTHLIKLALQVAHEATETLSDEQKKIATVFSSCEGDTEILDKNCTALTLLDRPISPTHFHNSVHNAPAGYWAIANKNSMPSTSIAAQKISFSAGLLDVAVYIQVEQQQALFVAYDSIAPQTLEKAVCVSESFATALYLSPVKTKNSYGELALSLSDQEKPDQMDNAKLEKLRTSNPAAHSLPLLSAVAKKIKTNITLPYLSDHRLVISYTPC